MDARLPELELDYEVAGAGWESSADGQPGDAATGDGIMSLRREMAPEVAPGQPQDRRRLRAASAI
jgi:hypothetical protein